MNAGLTALAAKRRRWVDANRENDFEAGIKRLLTELYPDNAHFLYELLQNAEDAYATEVRFTVTDTCLTFEHDGSKLFSLDNVTGITSIGVSTKRDDPTAIGKFGVGFKAVFAYTQTPEIQSGDYCFRINDLVVPTPIESAHALVNVLCTTFRFPFDHADKTPELARRDIEGGLRGLADNTLLFLTHIRSIKYELTGGALGMLRRADRSDGRVDISTQRPDEAECGSAWLRFSKDVVVEDDESVARQCRLAIAYRLAQSDLTAQPQQMRLEPVEDGQVSIYFPVEKERPNLRFHLHAPFASTVARDSIRATASNDRLRDELAALLVESVESLRHQGLLTVDFLAVLPNPADALPAFYEPLRLSLVKAFQDTPLTLTRGGAHAPANSLYRGPARIAEVITDEDLSLFTGFDGPLWAANPQQQNQRADKFLDSLNLERWGWKELTQAFTFDWMRRWHEQNPQSGSTPRATEKVMADWVATLSDAKLLRLYSLLGEASTTQGHTTDVGSFRIVRTIVKGLDTHVVTGDAFFPPEGDVSTPDDVHFVKESVYAVGRSEAQRTLARSFLAGVGVRTFDARAIVERRLAKYGAANRDIGSWHFKDIRQFVLYWKAAPENVALFHDCPFLLGTSTDGNPSWCRPNALCLDKPYAETGLAEFVGLHGRRPLDDRYYEGLGTSLRKPFADFLRAIGIVDRLKVVRCSTTGNPEHKALRQDLQYGVRESNNCTNSDFTIKDLGAYLAAKSVAASRLIWDALISAAPECATAKYRPNAQYRIRQSSSQLVHILREESWISDLSGEFRQPADVARDDLPSQFPYDERNGLLAAIGFGRNIREKDIAHKTKNDTAKEFGFESADEAREAAALLRRLPISEWRSMLALASDVDLPQASVLNPLRRRQRVLEERSDAPSAESVKRERSVQPNLPDVVAKARAYLRPQYTNRDEQLICQCCWQVMPFKINGQHYFEAVQFLPHAESHHFQNRLALCPVCAAKYVHARETNDEEIQRLLCEVAAPDSAPSVELTIRLAGATARLRFVGTHWFDLRTVLIIDSGSNIDA